MERLASDIAEQFPVPEKKAVAIIARKGLSDFLFEHDYQLFRGRINQKQLDRLLAGRSPDCIDNDLWLQQQLHAKLKIKRLCRAYPVLVGIDKKDGVDAIYQLKVYSRDEPDGRDLEVSGNVMVSCARFKTVMANKVSFGFFDGSEGDYKLLRWLMLDNYH